MKIKRSEIRVKKIFFTNDFNKKNFEINPAVSFNVEKTTDLMYKILCNVNIHNTSNINSPIEADLIIEGIFEFDEIDSNEKLQKYLSQIAFTHLYAHARVVLSNTSSICGLSPSINLPIIDFSLNRNVISEDYKNNVN